MLLAGLIAGTVILQNPDILGSQTYRAIEVIQTVSSGELDVRPSTSAPAETVSQIVHPIGRTKNVRISVLIGGSSGRSSKIRREN